ncbi:MAG: cyclic nucleotide-binding domain-containing protein [Lacunisphaera sp.]
MLKHRVTRDYLVITRRQWHLLQEFGLGPGRTIRELLCLLIEDRYDPELRELYELVVKAARAGVLQSEQYPGPAPVAPIKWLFPLPGGLLRGLAILTLLAAVAGMALHPPPPLVAPLHLLWGWLAAGVAASLGTLLAASVVRASGGEVYDFRLEWKTPLPRLEVDLEDALLGGRRTEVDAALARLLPHFALPAAAAFWFPEWQLPFVLGALLALCPLWESPLRRLLGARFGQPRLTTAQEPAFASDSWLWLRRAPARPRFGKERFLLANAVAAAVWLALVFLLGCALLQIPAGEVLVRIQGEGVVRNTALAGIALAGLAAAGMLGFPLGAAIREVRRRRRERTERRLRPAAVLVSPRTIAEWLGRTVLFRDLPAEELAALAEAVRSEEHRRGSYVVREGEPGDRLYVVLSGRLEVRRDYAPGCSEPIAEISEGDVFGEIALLEGGLRTSSVRARERSVLLSLDKEDFERLVLSQLSRHAVELAVQKIGFLQHLRLTRNWSHKTLAAFARRMTFQEFTGDARLIETGRANAIFFLLHRGELAVHEKGKEVRRLKPGDSFGELSLLGGGYATATVTATGNPGSVFRISGADFIDFISRDFVVGLAWDATRTVRLDPATRWEPGGGLS